MHIYKYEEYDGGSVGITLKEIENIFNFAETKYSKFWLQYILYKKA